MKYALLISFLLSSVITAPTAAWAKAGELLTANGVVICGGTVDDRDLDFKHIPGGQILRGSDDLDKLLVYFDFSKKGRIKLAFTWGMSEEEYQKSQKIEWGSDFVSFKEWLGNVKTVQYIGFTDGYIQLDYSRGSHTLSLSCKVSEVPRGPVTE